MPGQIMSSPILSALHLPDNHAIKGLIEARSEMIQAFALNVTKWTSMVLEDNKLFYQLSAIELPIYIEG